MVLFSLIHTHIDLQIFKLMIILILMIVFDSLFVPLICHNGVTYPCDVWYGVNKELTSDISYF